MIVLHFHSAISDDWLDLPSHLKLQLLEFFGSAFSDFVNVAQQHQSHLIFTFLDFLETSVEVDGLVGKFVDFLFLLIEVLL